MLVALLFVAAPPACQLDHSVVRDYREQYGRIITEHGWVELMRRMNAKIREMR